VTLREANCMGGIGRRNSLSGYVQGILRGERKGKLVMPVTIGAERGDTAGNENESGRERTRRFELGARPAGEGKQQLKPLTVI